MLQERSASGEKCSKREVLQERSNPGEKCFIEEGAQDEVKVLDATVVGLDAGVGDEGREAAFMEAGALAPFLEPYYACQH